jgi:hypothetical protein
MLISQASTRYTTPRTRRVTKQLSQAAEWNTIIIAYVLYPQSGKISSPRLFHTEGGQILWIWGLFPVSIELKGNRTF